MGCALSRCRPVAVGFLVSAAAATAAALLATSAVNASPSETATTPVKLAPQSFEAVYGTAGDPGGYYDTRITVTPTLAIAASGYLDLEFATGAKVIADQPATTALVSYGVFRADWGIPA